VPDSFSFLASIEDVIHVEVRKLYPDAELPRFESTFPVEGSMEFVYRSPRHFDDLAAGLIAGCIEHFGEDVQVTRSALDDGVAFHLMRTPV
jgi:hypothetical protein